MNLMRLSAKKFVAEKDYYPTRVITSKKKKK